jgi:hypothetical protein
MEVKRDEIDVGENAVTGTLLYPSEYLPGILSYTVGRQSGSGSGARETGGGFGRGIADIRSAQSRAGFANVPDGDARTESARRARRVRSPRAATQRGQHIDRRRRHQLRRLSRGNSHIDAYIGAFSSRAKSLSTRTIAGATHAFADKKSQDAYTSTLIAWLTEMIIGGRGAVATERVEAHRQERKRLDERVTQ